MELHQIETHNPRSLWSHKVLHNLGRRRTARLLAYVEPRDAVTRARVRHFAISLRATRSLLVADD